jgi:hypothetical protein
LDPSSQRFDVFLDILCCSVTPPTCRTSSWSPSGRACVSRVTQASACQLGTETDGLLGRLGRTVGCPEFCEGGADWPSSGSQHVTRVGQTRPWHHECESESEDGAEDSGAGGGGNSQSRCVCTNPKVLRGISWTCSK